MVPQVQQVKPIEFLCSGWRFSFFVLAGFFFTVFHQRPVDSKVSSIVLNSTSALIACGAIFLSIAAFPSLFCQYFMGAIIFLFEYFLAWNITSRPSSCRSTPTVQRFAQYNSRYICWMAHLVAHKLPLAGRAARGLTPVRCAAGRSEPAPRADPCRFRRQRTGAGSTRASRSRSARYSVMDGRRACAGRVVRTSGCPAGLAVPLGVTRGRRPARQGQCATCIAVPRGLLRRYVAPRAAARGGTRPAERRGPAPCRCAGEGPGPRTGPQADSETGPGRMRRVASRPDKAGVWRGAAGLLPHLLCFIGARKEPQERAGEGPRHATAA